jgi:hypothetical protein
VDFLAAVVLTVVTLGVTAGLGVVALLELLVGAGVIASYLLERSRRRRRGRSPRARPPAPRCGLRE